MDCGENGIPFLGHKCPAFDGVVGEKKGGGDQDAVGKDSSLIAVPSTKVEDFVGIEFLGEGDMIGR